VFKSREGADRICGACLKAPKRFGIARAAVIYERSFMVLIHCLKYKGKIQLARPLGILLFATFIKYWPINRIDLILPVPLHIKRLRTRGFNQSFLLLRDWSSFLETLNEQRPQVSVERHVLLRSKWTEPQTGLGRKQRMSNIKNAFSLGDLSRVQKKRILLVDDVYTTGATVDECAKVLLRGGARRVDVLTLARSMG
jgi:ComF family protein